MSTVSNTTLAMVGKEYGYLTVLRWLPVAERTTNKQYALRCHCFCGAELDCDPSNLRLGKTTNCGCLGRTGFVVDGVHSTKHPLYKTWENIVQRCTNKGHRDYANYGGRGISLCPEWRASFAAFVAGVGPRPAPHLTLDRTNNDGNYEPGNTRWATVTEQNHNQRWNQQPIQPQPQLTN